MIRVIVRWRMITGNHTQEGYNLYSSWCYLQGDFTRPKAEWNSHANQTEEDISCICQWRDFSLLCFRCNIYPLPPSWRIYKLYTTLFDFNENATCRPDLDSTPDVLQKIVNTGSREDITAVWVDGRKVKSAPTRWRQSRVRGVGLRCDTGNPRCR